MGDLSDIIPEETKTVQAIYDYHKQLGDSEKPRGYLGASAIGHGCDRYLWYSFRQCCKPSFSGRLYRLFETGHLAEPRFIKELKAIGCEVYADDGEGQFGVMAIGGHFRGHLDGVAKGILEAPETWHLLEFKTSSAKLFAKLKKEGVIAAKPVHFAQMQVYMGLAKLTRALYLVANKDTDELYSERVRYDAKAFAAIMARAERVIKSIQPPERCASRPDDFRCKFCDAHNLCWGTGNMAVPLPSRTCRSCCHATPEVDKDESWARWSCALHQRDLTLEEQKEACDNHLLIPGLITFADPVDAGQNSIEFKNHSNGETWTHGEIVDGWSTKMLMKTPVAEVRNIIPFGDSEPTKLIDRYPYEDSELLWDGAANLIDNYEHLDVIVSLDQTDAEEDEETSAVEYNGQYLVVLYKKHQHVAIWKGKE